MRSREKKLAFINKTTLQVVGTVLVLVLAVALLWHLNANSMQALPALMAQVRFMGEYRINDGPWQEITEDGHIPSTQGDVTLRGHFHMFAPNGEYVDIYSGDMPVALYLDHINLIFYEGNNAPYVFEAEDPQFGASACGEHWVALSFTSESREPIELRIHNPHSYGNEMAIDEMLSQTAFWSGIDFEKDVLKSGESQRNMGLFFSIVALVLLGTALFSTLIHIKNSKFLWVLGLMILFAGLYFVYSAKGIFFWHESVISNTTVLGSSMMLYMLCLSIVIVYFLETTKKAGVATVVFLGAVNAALFVLPIITDLLFFDLWRYWILAQMVGNGILLICIIKERFVKRGKGNWIYIVAILPLVAFGIDAVMTGLGVWKGGVISKGVFIILFAAVMVVVLRIIPQGINAAEKAKELETEKTLLNAQLTQSRISTMMSQIRPHFIYNTLGSIEQLCELDPKKAGELVHNFAKYLRGNFGELDNPKPISMSQEMDHVHYYISIENVRFPDMTFAFEMNCEDFQIPALTVQPIVENAIKHGLMKLPKGGTIRVRSYETDTHYCVTVEDDGVGFDTNALLDDRKHVGLRNIRERLKEMVDGTLEIESTVGVGTKVRINIPKEAKK